MGSWVIYAFLAAIFASFVSVLQKKALFREHAMEYAASYSFLLALFSLPLLLFIDLSLVPPVVWGVIIFNAFLISVAFIFGLKSVRHLALSDSAPLLVLGPAITALFAFILIGEALSLVSIFGILVLVSGAYTLQLRKDHSLFDPLKLIWSSKHIHFILFALMLYGVTATIDRVVLSSYGLPTLTYLFLANIFISLFLFSFLTIFHDGIRGVRHGLKINASLLFFAALLALGYKYTLLTAFSLAPVGPALAIRQTSTLFAVVVGGRLFHEKNLFRKILATIIMITGAILVSLG